MADMQILLVGCNVGSDYARLSWIAATQRIMRRWWHTASNTYSCLL